MRPLSIGNTNMDYENGTEFGWIKIHRKLRNKGFYKKSSYVHLWLHLLLSANHAPVEFMWNGGIVIVKAGQLITGRKNLAEETGISESTIERILKVLENEHQIEQQTTTKYRLITIVNWDSHQKVDIKVDNKRTASGQQADTNKNNNNNKNNNTASEDAPLHLEEFVSKCRKSKQRHINLIGEYADEKKIGFTTKGQWNSFLRRNLRPARALAPFDDKQIGDAMRKLKNKTYVSEWTLETLSKFLEH